MHNHGCRGAAHILHGIAPPQLRGLGQRQPLRNVSVQRIVRAGLVGENIRHYSAPRQFRHHVGAVAHQANRNRFAARLRLAERRQRSVQAALHAIAVASVQAAADAVRIDVDAQKAGAVHHRRQRLRAAHPAHAARHHQLARQRSAEVPARHRREGLEGPLHDALAADINPRARRHLPVHGEPQPLQPVEFVPVRPVAHQVGVGDQHAWRFRSSAKNAHRPPRLHQQRFVVFERTKRAHNRVECLPASRRAAGAAVHDQLVRLFSHFRVQIVMQHAQGGFLVPALAGECAAPRRADGRSGVHISPNHTAPRRRGSIHPVNAGARRRNGETLHS